VVEFGLIDFLMLAGLAVVAVQRISARLREDPFLICLAISVTLLSSPP
jgi:hypothetical protein